MFDRIFGQYLESAGKISHEQLDNIYSTQEERRVRLGVIAVSEQLMSIEDVEEVNQLQALYDKRFGDIAIEQGFLDEEQVCRLLSLQGNPFLAFVQAIVDLNIMDMSEINLNVADYQASNGLSDDDIENLKSCDFDRIIPIFTKEQPKLIQRISGVALRTIGRLIDYHLCIDKPQIVKSVDYKAIAVQELVGDHHISTAIAGELNPTLSTAVIKFVGAENVCDSEDILDGCCELINCINGIFATDLSNENVDIDMEAPYHRDMPGVISGDNILRIPMTVCGNGCDLLIALDSSIELA